MMQHTPLTLEEARVRLGGSSDMPWSVRQVRELLRAGHIRGFGRGDNLRIIEASLDRFLESIATGTVTWPPKEAAHVKPVKQTKSTRTKDAPKTEGTSMILRPKWRA